MRLTAIITVLLITLIAGSALAEVYRYTDRSGELHFVDDIAKVPKKYRKQLENPKPMAEISVMDAAPVSKRNSLQAEVVQSQAKPAVSSSVEVFVTSSCGYCRKMLRFLNEKGIPYTAHDIEKDSGAARAFRELGGRGVPVVRIGSNVVHGYNPDAVLSYLNQKK